MSHHPPVGKSTQNSLSTKASSINRALDEIGDKWSLLILQEVFWGINTFTDMLLGTGASRGVLSDRLNWLQKVDCLRKDIVKHGNKRPIYHLTKKSIELYANGLMAMNWERKYFSTPSLDALQLTHNICGQHFWPVMECQHCNKAITLDEVSFRSGPGASRDQRVTKIRRRSSASSTDQHLGKTLYRNLINLLGDRWTANIIALSFHGLSRFDEFHQELPVATNILTDRLRHLVTENIFHQRPYQQNPPRYDYRLTNKGRDLFPYFVTLLLWGDRWCASQQGQPMLLQHDTCGMPLEAQVRCNQCRAPLIATEVQFKI
ncbi:MAG: winged helix-turn-helix transcriptional regulator [Porticoccaceae bacterium]|nr:winged helix-turn-helix transcriptional regulator [Porticoccaceae bacterium]MDG1473913.1 winged helix-turn-helix transcriptional regulator [Porticoccaceae bacterium]